MKAASITPDIQVLIKSASKKLKRSDKRHFMAEMAESLCGNSPRLAETMFGFCRQTVQLSLNADIRALVDPESQADPQLRNTFLYTCITASSLRQQLMEVKGWLDE